MAPVTSQHKSFVFILEIQITTDNKTTGSCFCISDCYIQTAQILQEEEDISEIVQLVGKVIIHLYIRLTFLDTYLRKANTVL